MGINTSRIGRLLDNLEQSGAQQMLITDANSIYYLTGSMIQSGSRLMALLVRKDGAHRLFLNQIFPVPEGLGIEVIRFSDTDNVDELIARHTDHTLALGIDQKMPAGHLLALQELNAGTAYRNTSGCLSAVRGQKDLQEQEKMREASRINDLAMAEFKKLICPGVSELEVARQIEGIYRALGADGISFGPLVSFGANAANPHHRPDHTVLKEGDCVLFDVGCRKDFYCSDMTRTFFYKTVSQEQREIYQIVLQANLAGEAAIHPGARFCDVDHAARSVIEEAGYGPCFTHRLGHSIGLEVHEPGDANPYNTDQLREGNIFSCEPGVYLKGRFGVRIEDLCLVTADGLEKLNQYPKELEIIP